MPRSLIFSHFFTRVGFVFFLLSFSLRGQTVSPADFPGLKLWLTGDSVHLATGADIDTVYDLSPGVNHAVQNNSSFQATSVNSGLNGHKLMRFDGTNDFFSFTEIADMRTVFWVMKEDSDASFNYRGLFGHTTDYDFFRNENNKSMYGQYTHLDIRLGVTKINSVVVNGTTTFVPTEMSIISLVTTGNVKADNFSKDRSNGDRVWDGDVAEIIIYNQPLDSAQVDSIETYLKLKYAPPLDLGPDQTLCNFPFTLYAKKDYFRDYLWQDASTADTFVVTGPGVYYLKTTDIFNVQRTDTIRFFQDTTTYTVNLGNDTTICTGQQVTFMAGPANLEYSWSNGSVLNSVTVDSSAVVVVSVTDCPGNVTFDSVVVNVNPLPSFDLGTNAVSCYNQNLVLNPALGGPYNYLWSDSTTAATLSVSSGGLYWLSVTDSIGCNFRDSVSVVIDSSLSNFTLGPDSTFCAGNFIFPVNAGSVQGYLWSDSSTGSSLQVQATGTYWLTVTNGNGCSRTDSVSITVSGMAPAVSFASDTVCFGNATQFTDLSVPPSGDNLVLWSWDFGDFSSSSLQHPFHTYSDTGLFSVTLMATTDAGCSNLFVKNVRVFPNPSADFSFSGICELAPANFSDQSLAYGYPVTQYSWNFGDPGSGVNNLSNFQDPVHYYAGDGNYQVQLILVNSSGCTDTITKTVAVKPSPVADFSWTLACAGNSVQFSDLTNFPPSTSVTGSSWDFDDGGISALVNPAHYFSTEGNYNVVHTVTASNGCSDTLNKPVNVFAAPVAAFTAQNSCVNDSVSFSDVSSISSGSIVSWSWNFNSQSVSAQQHPDFIFSTSGSKTVKLVVTSDNGCMDSVSSSLNVFPLPLSSFSFSPDYGNPPLVVTFTNTSTGAVNYLWDFGDGGQSTVSAPSHTFADTGVYILSLRVSSIDGCVGIAYDTIRVLPRFYDVAVTEIYLDIQDDFMKVSAQLSNLGTSDVSSMDVYLRSKDGSYIKESWTGSFPMGTSFIYDFGPEIFSGGDEQFICVFTSRPDGADDAVPANDELCRPVQTKSFIVMDPYPNPAGETLTLPLVLPAKGELIAEIFDAAGKRIGYAWSGEAAKGLQFISYDCSSLATGLYACRITYAGKTVVKKFMKRSW